MSDEMIRYNHPGDTNVWFRQYAKDPVPVWAVNVEPALEEPTVFEKGAKAIELLIQHYRDEIRPYADAKGHSREQVLAAAHRALDGVFNTAWPSDEAVSDWLTDMAEFNGTGYYDAEGKWQWTDED